MVKGIQHLGIIMDGNRRLAKAMMKKPWEGHKMGVKKAREVLEWSCEKGIKYLTSYTLSGENLKSRPKLELKYILKLLSKECDQVLEDKEHPVNRLDVKVRFIGRTHLLPDELQEKLKEVEDKTSGNKEHVLNIALAYGGQQEITDATREIANKCLGGNMKPADINEESVSESLYTNGQPAPDLIIRTGGEKRLSNFLSFQSAYSELMFLKKKWPEMKKEDFEKALQEFEDRQRRFGK